MSREQARPSRAEQGPFHYRRWRVGLLLAMQLAVLLALAGTQVKARARFRAEVVKRISLAQHLTPPTFLEARRLTLMDRGQLLYLGQGTKQETGQFQLLRLADLQLIKQRAPLADSPGNEASARVLDLLFYDSELGQAGFHVRLRGADGFEQRYLHWDLKQNRITRVERYVNSFSSMRPIGFSPRRGLLYCQVVRQPARKGQRQPLEVIALGPKPARRIVQIQVHNALSRGPFYDEEHERALIVEYAERGVKGPAPQGYLVDLQSGKVLRLRIPLTTYGAAFARDGQTIFLYSAQRGTIWVVDSKTGRKLRERRVGGQGHALGMPFVSEGDETLLLVRSSGLLFLQPPRLRWLQQLPIDRLFQGFSQVAGSLVGPGLAFVKNGTVLYVVRLQRAR